MTISRLLRLLVAGLLGGAVAHSAQAVELSDRLHLHGFGQAGSLWASANSYENALAGEPDHYLELALLLTANLTERSNAWVLVHSLHGEVRVD